MIRRRCLRNKAFGIGRASDKEEGEEKTIKVRSIEADFTRLMFEEA